MKRNNSGFSMIEVLVASTIMLMMVMMLGSLFHQSSLAWRTGRQRAETYQQVRALFGAIQRDASTAIDQYSLPQSLIKELGCGDQSFSAPLAFYTLTGTGFNHPNDWPIPSAAPRRSLKYVTYNGVTRTIKKFIPRSGGGYELDNSPGGDGAIVSANGNGAQVKLTKIEAVADPSAGVKGGNPFPAYVTVSAEVVSDGVRSFDVGAGSGGPNRVMGQAPGDLLGRDDIKTWVD